MSEQLLSQNEAAKYIGVSNAMLMRLRLKRRIPFIQMSPSFIRYRISDLDAFMKSCYVAAVEKTA